MTSGEVVAGPGEGHTPVILLAEDDVLVRFMTAEILRDAGYIVLEAAAGRSALKLLESKPGIELLLSDLSIRDVDGEAFVDVARRRWPHLKVLLTTGRTGLETRTYDARHPVLHKPFSLNALASSVRRVLDQGADAAAAAAPTNPDTAKSYGQD